LSGIFIFQVFCFTGTNRAVCGFTSPKYTTV